MNQINNSFDKNTHPKTMDGQFACTKCVGRTYIEEPDYGFENDGLPIKVPCKDCNGTGYYVVQLLNEIEKLKK
jgi:hypothetical protein